MRTQPSRLGAHLYKQVIIESITRERIFSSCMRRFDLFLFKYLFQSFHELIIRNVFHQQMPIWRE